jgi:hypothetical protein
MNRRFLLLFAASLALSVAAVAQQPAAPAAPAALNFVVEPTYTPSRAQQVYGPLVQYLSKQAGVPIKLITYRSYHLYWTDMRRKQDWHLVFDDPHFTDYRIQRLKYTPLAKSSMPVTYALLAENPDETPSIDDYAGRPVATMPAPSFGFAYINQLYPNPLQQPVLMTSAQNWRDTVEIMANGDAEAIMVPGWLMNEYSNLVPIQVSPEMPGVAISASPSVPAAVREKLKAALFKMHEDQKLYEVLAEIGIQQFVPATAEEYKGNEAKLKSAFGYGR